MKKSTKRSLKMFTPGQIKLLLNNKSKTRWGNEDIASAISLRSISPKAYNYLKDVKKHPLPGMSTLREWAKNINIAPGLLTDVLEMMEEKAKLLSLFEKITVISMDEVYISHEVAIDRREEQVIGPHRTVQVVMARGLFKRWKHPIFFDFDRNMNKEILLHIIEKLYDSGFTVICAVSDLGSSKAAMWRSVKIGVSENEQCFFLHPRTDQPVFVLYDAPHAIKLARNHFLNHGFEYKGSHITAEMLHLLVEKN